MSPPSDRIEPFEPFGDASKPSDGSGVEIFAGSDTSLLDLMDNLLNQGVVLTGDVVLGLAGVDLVYLRLNALLCASDRILPRSKDKEKQPEEDRG